MFNSLPLFLFLSLCIVKTEELQTIKRELTVIKMQIDGLLDSLDRMDRQRQESKGQRTVEQTEYLVNTIYKVV